MAVNEEQVIIKIKGDNVGAEKALKDTAAQLQNLQKVAQGPIGAISGLSSLLNFSLPLAASAAAAGLTSVIKNSIDYADQLNKMSQRTGMTVEQLSAMKMALDLSDVTLEQFETSIARFNNYLQENKKYTGNVYDELLKVADQFANMKDSSEKAALAIKMFGRTGTELIPLLNQGSEGFKRIAEQAREFGLIIDTETAVKAEYFNDRLMIMKNRFEGLGNTISYKVLNAFDRLAYTLENNTFKTWLSAVLGGIPGLIMAVRSTNFEYEKHIQNLINEKRARENLNKSIEETLKSQKDEEERLKKLQEQRKREKEQLEKEFASINSQILESIQLIRMGYENASLYSKELMKLQVEYQKWIDRFGEAKAKGLYDNKIIEITLKYREEISRDYRPIEEDPNERYKKELKAFEDFQLNRIMIAESVEKAISEIEERERKKHEEGYRILQSSMDGFLEYLADQSEGGLQLFKAYKSAEALISTYSAAIKAYESLVGIPIVGPILATAAAGAAIAFGLAQVAKIQSMQRNSTGGGMAKPTAPSYNIPSVTGSTGSSGGGKQIVTINIYGSVVDHDKFAREIIPSINKAIKDGVR